MKRHWQVHRQVQPVMDGARRWDRAYMLILGWNLSGSRTALTEADGLCCRTRSDGELPLVLINFRQHEPSRACRGR